MKLQVNGRLHEVRHGDEALVWVLRDELGLTGTHYGCGIGMCGSCTVLVNGEATRSCQMPARAAQGQAITTLEGLATRSSGGEVRLHPVQQAFLESPLQCLWCIPGHVMTAVALLDAVPRPSTEQIEAHANRNLCRCGGYNTIRKAVARAVELTREEA
ncbi:(2Fe-2S)-binding protein [Deinococcus oregonensis]|uniref:(2Fe-2S)-binding protein n=1 Tax=Deinococcus oregonensis TaxID=1805970 RepID=A0ABV6AYT3_9DEIO